MNPRSRIKPVDAVSKNRRFIVFNFLEDHLINKWGSESAYVVNKMGRSTNRLFNYIGTRLNGVVGTISDPSKNCNE